MLAEQVLAIDEGVLAIHVEAPAVERADEALRPAIAVPAGFGQLDAAMAAGVVEGLHPVLGPDNNDRLAEIVIFDPVADLGDLLQPAGHLPHVRPQLLDLEPVEFLVIIAFGGDALRIGYTERYCHPLDICVSHQAPHWFLLPNFRTCPGVLRQAPMRRASGVSDLSRAHRF